jgi:hypothetical protein
MSSLVLLVESDDGVARAVRAALHQASYRVISCSSAPEGASLAFKHAPEFVLIGRLELRRELGRLLESVRHHPLTAAAPVLFIPRPESPDFDSYVSGLPQTLENVRPAEDAWAGSPDLGVLPTSVRNALAQVLGAGRQLSEQARRLPIEQSQALGATIREAGRMLDRLGLFILTRPEPRANFSDASFSTQLMISLGSCASRTSRSEALHLAILPCAWRDDPMFIEAVTETVCDLLSESSVAVSLKPTDETIVLKLIAADLQLGPDVVAELQRAAGRRLDEPVSKAYGGRFASLANLIHERAWSLLVHSGNEPGVKLRVEIPYWLEKESGLPPIGEILGSSK